MNYGSLLISMLITFWELYAVEKLSYFIHWCYVDCDFSQLSRSFAFVISHF